MAENIKLVDFCRATGLSDRTMMRWLKLGLFKASPASDTDMRVSAWMISRQTALGLMAFCEADKNRAGLAGRKKKDLRAAFQKILTSDQLAKSVAPVFMLFPDGVVLVVEGHLVAYVPMSWGRLIRPTAIQQKALVTALNKYYGKCGCSVCSRCCKVLTAGEVCAACEKN